MPVRLTQEQKDGVRAMRDTWDDKRAEKLATVESFLSLRQHRALRNYWERWVKTKKYRG